jgi:hypothetical protein
MKFAAAQNINGKNFIRLKAGESVRGVFRGEPFDFKQHWVNNRGQMCPGDGCALCAEGKKPSFRFRINFIINDNGAYVAKVFEQGWTVYETMKNLHESEYNLDLHQMKITRHGSGQNDTTYSIIPVPNGTIDEAKEKVLSSIKLHELREESLAEGFAEANLEEGSGF